MTDAVNRMALQGVQVAPEVIDPCGLIVLVAYPNGDFKFKAELLPEGKEIDYAIEMLRTALDKLETQRAMDAIKRDEVVRVGGGMPTLERMTG